MIFTDRTITVRKGESRIDEPIVVYRGDYELEVRFTILNSKFRFMSGTNLIESEKASYGQLAILTPYGGNIFSDIVRCNDGSVTFVLTAEMLNQIEEVGLYSFQIRLMDYTKESRVSIPPIEFGIEVREPIASEDHDNGVNNAIVGYSIAKVVDPKEEKVGDTFDGSGNYNKTKWETGDRISEGKLNKIEDAIDKVNQNEKDNTVTLSKRIDNNFNVLDATKADITDVTVLTNRIDNMSRLNDGSTTGDAELIDARVGRDGKVYANAGSAIRGQCDDIYDTVNYVKNFAINNYTIPNTYNKVGYLSKNGSIIADVAMHSIVSDKIPCNPGWSFSYAGLGEAYAVSWIFYNGDVIVDFGQYKSATYSDKTIVVIPENVDFVQFASYDLTSKDIMYHLELLYDGKDENTSIVYSNLSHEIHKAIPMKKNNIPLSSLTKYTNAYLHINGLLIDQPGSGLNYYSMKLSTPDVVFSYKTDIQYKIAPYAFCDENGNIIEVGGDRVNNVDLVELYFDEIIPPKDAASMILCSATDNIELYRLLPVDFQEALSTYEYEGVDLELIDILDNYDVIEGEYLNGNGGFVSNADSVHTDFIPINEHDAYYITAHSIHSTCIVCIYDNKKILLGNKGYAKEEGETTWNDECLLASDILEEYPEAYYIVIGHIQYGTGYELGLKTRRNMTVCDMVNKLNDKIENVENIVSGVGNVLYGKKWVACGDSFTEGDFSGFVDENGLSGVNSPVIYDSNRGMYKTYPWWIAERNNMILINEAKCGSTMALSNEYLNGTNPDINHRRPFSLNRYKNIPLDTDYLTLWFGLNETKTPLGTLNDSDNTTIIGAWNIVLEYFLTNMPYCKIGIVISDGWLSDEYANGIISVAEYWGIPYLDLRNDPKVPLMLGGRGGSINLNNRARILRNNAFYVTENNAHPNVKAHEYQSTFIEHWMRSL